MSQKDKFRLVIERSDSGQRLLDINLLDNESLAATVVEVAQFLAKHKEAEVGLAEYEKLIMDPKSWFCPEDLQGCELT